MVSLRLGNKTVPVYILPWRHGPHKDFSFFGQTYLKYIGEKKHMTIRSTVNLKHFHQK